MPSHALHLLQPLNVSYFSSLKTAYGAQVSDLISCHINHITKLEFLLAFKAAFKKTIIKKNICVSFKATSLVLLDIKVVLL